jgi:hypothetical protein
MGKVGKSTGLRFGLRTLQEPRRGLVDGEDLDAGEGLIPEETSGEEIYELKGENKKLRKEVGKLKARNVEFESVRMELDKLRGEKGMNMDSRDVG